MKDTIQLHFKMLTVAAVICLLLFGCMFKELKKEIQEEKISWHLYGRVENTAQAESHVYVLLYVQVDGEMQLESFVLPDDTGTYAFLATPGTYAVAGFEDMNNNQRHDPGEPAGAWGSPDNIVVAGGAEIKTSERTLHDLDFELTPGRFPLDNVISSVENNVKMASMLVKLGELSSWDDPAFSQENATTGFWKPMTFLKQHGVGIYFMAPFDPNKIPILFVHGAAGTPQSWKTLAASLDPKRFQPWVYYYPSGMRLDALSTALNRIVNRLQEEYGVQRMGVVAHSMGGLVSRSFILKHLLEGGQGTVEVFVSYSTPWGGVGAAAKGVEKAPEAIPSWRDVEPKSEFIKNIYAEHLHSRIPHYLLFGFGGDCSLFMANNDGSVEVSSELDVRAQDDAVFVRGMNEDHMSILESEKAAEYLNMALEAAF